MKKPRGKIDVACKNPELLLASVEIGLNGAVCIKGELRINMNQTNARHRCESSWAVRCPSLGRYLVAVTLLATWPLNSLQAQLWHDEEAGKFRETVQKLLLDRKFGELNQLAEQLRKDQPRFPSGNSQLAEFYAAVSISGGENGQDRLQRAQDRIAQIAGWVDASDSVTARIALARALIQKGWEQRGRGFSNQVNEQGWRDFIKAMESAEKILNDTETLGKKLKVRDPELYHAWMLLAEGLGYDRKQSYKYMDQGLSIDPLYDSLIESAVNYSLPKWGGNSGDIAKLADHVSQKTSRTVGEAGYALVAVHAIDDPLFQGTLKEGLSWKRMRVGLLELVKRSPGSPLQLGRLLNCAYLSDDRDTAAEAAAQLRGRWPYRIFLTEDNYLRVERWSRPDFRSGAARTILEGFRGTVQSVTFMDEGAAVVGTGSNGEIIRFDVLSGKRRDDWECRIHFPSRVATIGRRELVVAGFDIQGNPDLICVNDQDVPSGFDLGQLSSQPMSLVADPRRAAYVVGLKSGSIRYVKHGEIPQPYEWKTELAAPIWDLALSQAGTQLASLGGSEIIVWNLESRTQIRRWKCADREAVAMAWSPDGATIATGGWGNEIRLWNAATGERAGELIGGNSSFNSLVFSTDGSRLVAGTGSWQQLGIPGEIVVWKMPEKTRLATLAGHALGIEKVVISPDNKTIASASKDGTVRLWDLP